MLSRLYITNYALIDKITVDFNRGMTVITGETGAGKSIILGALGLTLGDRVDTSVLRNTEGKCVIESTFDISSLNLQSFFKENELDFETETILRREITPQGKSRAFINDTPVSLQVLKELSSLLIDVHSQHQVLLLNNSDFQIDVLDTFASNQTILKEYRSSLLDYQKIKNQLEGLKAKEQQLKNDLDYFQFQLNELEAITLDEIDEEELEAELDVLANAEDIKQGLSVVSSLNDDDQGILQQLSYVEQLLTKLSSRNKSIDDLLQRIVSSKIEIQDIIDEAENINDNISLDPSRLEELTDQYNAIQALHKKHFTTSLAELIEKRNEIRESVQQGESFDADIERLTNQFNQQEAKLKKLAKELTASRTAVKASFEKAMMESLTYLSMPKAVFDVNIQASGSFRKNGIDEVTFEFSANKGMPTKALTKTASGGELSRVMLCLKQLMAKHKSLPTIIFDEIDTGVSGEVANQMGEVMRSISKTTQVYAITHLPQIAGKGDQHLFVYKEEKAGETFTNIKSLVGDDRLSELAKMLSGNEVTSAALENAKILINS